MSNWVKKFVLDGAEYLPKDSGSVRFDENMSLTEEQKAVARDNIGAGTGSGSSGDDVFWGEYGVTSCADIVDANDEGKIVIVTKTNSGSVYNYRLFAIYEYQEGLYQCLFSATALGTVFYASVTQLIINDNIVDSWANSTTHIPSIGTSVPLMDGVASAGSNNNYSRVDHVHPKDTSKANVDSPSFTGTPTAPTPTSGDDSTKIATTEYVQNELSDISVDANSIEYDTTENYQSGSIGYAIKNVEDDVNDLNIEIGNKIDKPSSPTTNDVLKYNGTEWVSAPETIASDSDIQNAVDTYLDEHPTVSGTFSNEAKYALLNILDKIAYIDESISSYISAFQTALFSSQLISITAIFTQGDNVVYNTDDINSLKTMLVVTAHYSDNSSEIISGEFYELSGSLDVGTDTITVTYSGMTDTFEVVVTEAQAIVVDVSKFIVGATNNGNAPNYYGTNNARLSYPYFDLFFEGGKTYKFTCISTVSTAQIGVQCFTQTAYNHYQNSTTFTGEVFDSGWQPLVFTLNVPATYNGHDIIGFRLASRYSTSNPTIASNYLTSITVEEVRST